MPQVMALCGKSVFLGALSFEDRCRGSIEFLSQAHICDKSFMVEISPPAGAFPDFNDTLRLKISKNSDLIMRRGVSFDILFADLLVSEDSLLDLADAVTSCGFPSLFLDMSCFPKRFFCFLLKRLMRSKSIRNLIITYSQARGYGIGHLAEDPLPCDYLPGFSGTFPLRGSTFVISAGFESLGMSSFLEVYRDGTKDMKVLLAFPPNGEATRRQWSTIRQMISGRTRELRQHDIESVATWDAEHVLRVLSRWYADSDGLTLAPFGPKPHTLAMALFAAKYDLPLYYSQPRSYNPNYSTGLGDVWAYVIKWDGRTWLDL
jgi:hypothetical protein